MISPGISIRHGFATVFVIALLALVTTALAGIVLAARVAQVQTMTAAAEARLRQIELAAVIDATAHAATWGEAPTIQPWTVESPDGGSGRIEQVAAPGGESILRVRCTLGSARSVQSLRYVRSGSKWMLTEAAVMTPAG